VLRYPREAVGQQLYERAQMRIFIYNSGRRVMLRVASIAGTALEALVTLVWHQALRSICLASSQVGRVPHAPSDRANACVCDRVLVGSLN
jgi:hypothetical protein